MITGMRLWFCQPACRQASAQSGVIFIGKEDNGNVVGVSEYKRDELTYQVYDNKEKEQKIIEAK